MRNTWGRIGYPVGAALGLAAAAGCSVGQGAPDGWRYVVTGTVAVAHPKTWHETSDGAVFRGRDGRVDAALVISEGRAAAANPVAEVPAGQPGRRPAEAQSGQSEVSKRAKVSEQTERSTVAQQSEQAKDVGRPDRAKQPAAAYARRESLRIDGRRTEVLTYAEPAPDGRPAGHVEIRAVDPAGHPVLIRAWAVDGTAADDPSLLREIVNSVEFTSHRPR